MVDVIRKGDIIIRQIVVGVLGDMVINVLSESAPQIELSVSDNRHFWEEVDEIVRGIQRLRWFGQIQLRPVYAPVSRGILIRRKM